MYYIEIETPRRTYRIKGAWPTAELANRNSVVRLWALGENDRVNIVYEEEIA